MSKLEAKIAEKLSTGLSEDQQKNVVEALSAVLCDQHVLYIKLRNFHWNLKGPRFHSLHEFFEQQYTELALAIDETAERIRMVGGISPGSMKEFLSGASLEETDGDIVSGDEALKALVADNEAVIRDLREKAEKTEEDYGDIATADFLTELLQKHEMAAWMLRSYQGAS